MRVKAKNIAKALGYSEATVSLALNKKPGVSDKTRQDILQYLEMLDNSEPQNADNVIDENIAIVVVNKQLNIVRDPGISLWSDVLNTLERIVRSYDYNLSLINYDLNKDDVSTLIERCNSNMSGIILFATEMDEDDILLFSDIKVPMVIYDNDFCIRNYHSITIDNYNGVRKAVNYLFSLGHRRIGYIAHQDNIYNFKQRRLGFEEELKTKDLDPQHNMIIRLGSTIEEIYKNSLSYFKDNADHFDAFITENYQVSAGILQALRFIPINIPNSFSVIGIDELPSYLIMDYDLTCIKIEHAKRAAFAVECLLKIIQNESEPVYTIAFATDLVTGNTVKDRNL